MSTVQDNERSLALRRPQRTGMRSLFEEMDRMMGDSWGWPLRIRPFAHSLRSTYEWMPDTDIFERDGKIVVRADLPGMKRDDIDVSVQDDALILRGHREEEKRIDGDNYYGSERATGRFYRAIALPDGVAPDEIEALYQDGVLEITFPKGATQETRSVQIEVK